MIRYSATVFRFPAQWILLSAVALFIGCAAQPATVETGKEASFYHTLLAEIAANRDQPDVAGREYLAALGSEPSGASSDLAQRVAAYAMRSGQPALAMEAAQWWLRRDSQAAAAHRLAAANAMDLYRIDTAVRHYRAVLDAAGAAFDGQVALLQVDLDATRNAFAAAAVARQLLHAYPRSAPLLRLAGSTALRADDANTAISDFSDLLNATHDPDLLAEAEAMRARARIIAGDVERGLREAEALAKLRESPTTRFEYALALMAADRDDAAREQFVALGKQDALRAAALRALGILDLDAGKLDTAAAWFTEMIAGGSFVDDGYYYLGVIADRRGDLPLALRLYSRVTRGEQHVPAYMAAARALRTRGERDAADQLLQQLIVDEPAARASIETARANFVAENGDIPHSLAILDAAIQRMPDLVELRYAKAALLENSGASAAAIAVFNAIWRSRPDDPSAMNALGYTLADHGQELARAQRLIERAYRAAPQNAAIRDSLGWVLYRRGQTAAALPHLQDAYAADPGAECGAHLGEVLWRMGERVAAKRVWQDAEQREKGNAVLTKTVQRLSAEP